MMSLREIIAQTLLRMRNGYASPEYAYIVRSTAPQKFTVSYLMSLSIHLCVCSIKKESKRRKLPSVPRMRKIFIQLNLGKQCFYVWCYFFTLFHSIQNRIRLSIFLFCFSYFFFCHGATFIDDFRKSAGVKKHNSISENICDRPGEKECIFVCSEYRHISHVIVFFFVVCVFLCMSLSIKTIGMYGSGFFGLRP